ncbi:MAG: ferredoxin [Muribaculaceae bacterium]|nr:ferredoxin [Muribaculaceae bacterium]
MIINERDNRHARLLAVAGEMLTAIRTAPKGRGLDKIEAAVVDGDDIISLCDELERMCDATGKAFYRRDASNLREHAQCVVLIGVKQGPIGLNCGYCGFTSCGEKPAQVPCSFNTVDVGIAIGSACSTAADHRVDTRVMYSVGAAAMHLDMLPGCRQLFAIPLSSTSKNPFFDRPPVQ